MAGRNGNKRIGRNSKKCTAYKASGRREQHKIKRILQSNGLEAAKKYAKSKGFAETEYLNNLI